MLEMAFLSAPSFDSSKSFAEKSSSFDWLSFSLLLEIVETMLLNAISTSWLLSFDFAHASTALKWVK
jgi:hypothetical protein